MFWEPTLCVSGTRKFSGDPFPLGTCSGGLGLRERALGPIRGTALLESTETVCGDGRRLIGPCRWPSPTTWTRMRSSCAWATRALPAWAARPSSGIPPTLRRQVCTSPISAKTPWGRRGTRTSFATSWRKWKNVGSQRHRLAGNSRCAGGLNFCAGAFPPRGLRVFITTVNIDDYS